MKAYSKYKDSYIEWVGEIPEHWKEINLQLVASDNKYSFTGGPFGSDLKFDEYTDSGVRIIQLQNIGVGEFFNDYKIYTSEKKADELSNCNIYPNDIIIAKMADPVARACLMPNDDKRYLMASDGIRLEVDNQKYNKQFVVYALNSNYFRNQAEQHSSGTTRLRIGLGTLKKLKIICPSLEEQTQIAQFLDQKTSEIDTSIEQLQQLIDLLKEERNSLINEAVTKGIDPTVPMKDSGIEWIGTIPEHWKIKRLKYLVSGKLKYGANKSGEALKKFHCRYIRITDFGIDGKLRDNNKKGLNPEEAEEYLLEYGDLLLARSGATVGKVFQFKSLEKSCYAGYLIKASPNEEIVLSDFLYAYVQSEKYDNWKSSIFIQATIQNISAEKYANFVVSYPPIEEQHQIVQHIEKETQRIDTEIEYTQQEIALLKEYKQALITEAVTGKIDVRSYYNTQ